MVTKDNDILLMLCTPYMLLHALVNAPPYVHLCAPYKFWCHTRGESPGTYRSGTVNSKSFVGKVLLRIKWKFKLTYAL